MGLFQKNWQGSRHILQLFILNLVAWFFDIALAEEDVFGNAMGSFDFPITCLVNLSVFVVTLIRGGLDLENAAREVMGTLRGPKLEEINEINGRGLTTISIKEQNEASTEGRRQLEAASVVMLSEGTPNWSMKQFMKSCAIDDVHSILLQYVPLQNATMNDVKVAIGECSGQSHRCNCIVFWTVQEITILLARRMPGTLKSVSNSMCLLLCLSCVRKSCHGCKDDLLYVEWTNEQQKRLTKGDSRVESPAVVCEILDETAPRSIQYAGESLCMCIPLNEAGDDDWTRLLIRSFKSKDAEDRGVRDIASEIQQDYLDQRKRKRKQVEVTFSLRKQVEVTFSFRYFIGPRLSEILINLVLTFWFQVDGFASSLTARRTVRDYLIGSTGSGLASNAFLRKATLQFNDDYTDICQELTFRGTGFSSKSLLYIAGGVNLICFIGWTVLIAFERGDSAPPLSVPRLVVIVAAIGISCFMDCLYLYMKRDYWLLFSEKLDYMVLSVIILEIACIVTGSVVARVMGIKAFGRWVYSALQLLVCIKWVIGSSILDKHSSGCLLFSTAFLLNASLALVRSKWTPSFPWKEKHLFQKH